MKQFLFKIVDGKKGLYGEIKMEKPDKEDFKSTPEAGGGYRVINWPNYEAACVVYNQHLASLPFVAFAEALPNKEGDIVGENEFKFGWFVKTESYQGDGGGVFDTEKEANTKYEEWSKYNGQLQSFTHKPEKVAIPISNSKLNPPGESRY